MKTFDNAPKNSTLKANPSKANQRSKSVQLIRQKDEHISSLDAIANSPTEDFAPKRSGPNEEEMVQRKFETVHRLGVSEEELLQGKFETVQRQSIKGEEPLRGRLLDTPNTVTWLNNFQLQGNTVFQKRAMAEEQYNRMQKKHGGGNPHGKRRNIPSDIAEKQKEKSIEGISEKLLQNEDNQNLTPVQLKGINISHETPDIQRTPSFDSNILNNNTGLPDNLKSGIESLSGYSLDDVKVHYNSPKPSKLQAHAYAQGTDIHLASGQEKHLPHEAWHVVQQKQGRVKPTLQMKGGVNVNDDKGLEKEADVMGAKALKTTNSSISTPKERHSSYSKNIITQQVTQLEQIVPRAIDGLTHLVHMTLDGHIYNENYLENETDEVKFGDLLVVDLDYALFSRRGMNQEKDPTRDKNAEQVHLWVNALQLNGRKLAPHTFVRSEMLKEPIMINIPWERKGIDGAVGYVGEVIDKIVYGRKYEDIYLLTSIKQTLLQVKNGIVTKSADSVVDFVKIEEQIKQTKLKASTVFNGKKISEDQYQLLEKGLERVHSEFQLFSRPKRQMPVGGLIGKNHLKELGCIGLDLGGIGLEANYLDVNIDDKTNNPNNLVIGDAMNLQASFEPGCVNDVKAVLLPLILMVSSDSTSNRINAIVKVLSGVNYVTGGSGKASIQFNDNSGDAAVNEENLLLIGKEHGFKLINDNPMSQYRCFTFTKN